MLTSARTAASSNLTDLVSELTAWLVQQQAVHVPDGWTEACVTWLADEHGGLDSDVSRHLTRADWRQLVYEQWLHTDLHQLVCPVLPTCDPPAATMVDVANTSRAAAGATAMKLEGELCLQVVGLFNVGESYYGQLRRHEGGVSVNLPSFEAAPDAETSDGANATQMTQAVISQSTGNQSAPVGSCFSLFLTDGVTQVKAVEFGCSVAVAAGRHSWLGRGASELRPLPPDELLRRLRPGVKVRLRGPLTLRRNVLLFPSGAIKSLASPHLQVLGGEVDEILEGPSGYLPHQLGILLAKKLNVSLPADGSLPGWFPRTLAPEKSTSLAGEPATSSPQTATTVQEQEDEFVPPPSAYLSSPPLELWDENIPQLDEEGRHDDDDDEDVDDALLAQAAQTVERQSSSASEPLAYRLTSASARSSVNEGPARLFISGDTMRHMVSGPVRSPGPQRDNLPPDTEYYQQQQQQHQFPTQSQFEATIQEDAFDNDVDPEVLALAFKELEDDNGAAPAGSGQVKRGSSTVDGAKGLFSTDVERNFSSVGQTRLFQSTLRQSLVSSVAPDKTSSRRPISEEEEKKQGTMILPVEEKNEKTILSVNADLTTISPLVTSVPKKEESVDDLLLPPAPKRKPWERVGSRVCVDRVCIEGERHAGACSSADRRREDAKFQPYCFIQDIYQDLVSHTLPETCRAPSSRPSLRRVYTIRAILISLLSTLEHHQGTRWTLSARLADGSATVDVDLCPDLLAQWIGLTAAEGESLRQLSRVAGSAGQVAAVLQEAQKHRQRLRAALSNFQSCLSHLSGLFDLVPPPAISTMVAGSSSTASTSSPSQVGGAAAAAAAEESTKQLRPIVVAFRHLDEVWLRQLHNRVVNSSPLL